MMSGVVEAVFCYACTFGDSVGSASPLAVLARRAVGIVDGFPQPLRVAHDLQQLLWLQQFRVLKADNHLVYKTAQLDGLSGLCRSDQIDAYRTTTHNTHHLYTPCRET